MYPNCLSKQRVIADDNFQTKVKHITTKRYTINRLTGPQNIKVISVYTKQSIFLTEVFGLS